MDQIVKILVSRLKDKGIESAKIPSCIETAWNILFLYPIQNSQELNSRMQSLGWHNFEIDDHTFKLVKLIINEA